ncbi:hypothetical protein [Lacrimispora saccharolytica]|uniref:PsbP C-terminal domain-containing protein n=1 Tax=Lacrimispora saccharolytica (strain ATCC 35040 / DSM 2544 / NRCC 2533 / WM1) TaxID=610130 RepID=D9R9I4_LACSW|nr:hypothetical protein [Lacrimispora saccharolytica]ADL05935.1 hypothetical protein Closa_3408 [[Clostridium] saccharolyticum WM1]QRV19930.1 hypothetical protein I6K70_21460 [Lacrimispora saccharolytica]
MRKNKMLAVIAIAMAVMMAATACGSKDNQSTKPDVSTEAGTAETTKGTTDETKSSGETTVSEEDSEGGETATEDAKKAASDAGSISSGVFTSKSGKYQITPPQGWTIEEDGDESAVAFSSPNGSDLLEVTYVEGDEADSAREVYPNTMEEYKELVSRGEDMEFVRYNVENGSDGSQTFSYAIRYKNPQDGVRYYAISGTYNAAAKKYISAAGTVESPDSAVEGQIEAALDTLKLK